MGKVGVFFGTGFEEVEALTVVDLLRRVDIEVSMISIQAQLQVEGGHGIKVEMNEMIKNVDFKELNMIVLPGGLLGTKNLMACKPLMVKLKEFNENKKWIAAICAAPTILGHLGILSYKKACVYPGLEKELLEALPSEEEVEVVEHIITSKGLGTAIPFALAIIKELKGQKVARGLKKAIVYK